MKNSTNKKTTNIKKDKSGTVLAFFKNHVVSNGVLFGAMYDERKSKYTPLKIQEKTVRGSMSHRVSKKDNSMKITSPNLQTVDTCALTFDQDTLILKYTNKILGNVGEPSSCNKEEITSVIGNIEEYYREKYGYVELAKRYCANMAGCRPLFRNAFGAEQKEVEIKCLNIGSEDVWNFDASNIDFRTFNNTGEHFNSFVQKVANTLASTDGYLMLEITMYAKIGLAQEVYPSEELILEKGAKKKKILYEIGGFAGMHSQKIGNAIRTIDTWYPDYDDINRGPIPSEVYGTLTHQGVAYRSSKTSNFYAILDNYLAGGDFKENENDLHYFMSMLIRGGVFGKGKE